MTIPREFVERVLTSVIGISKKEIENIRTKIEKKYNISLVKSKQSIQIIKYFKFHCMNNYNEIITKSKSYKIKPDNNLLLQIKKVNVNDFLKKINNFNFDLKNKKRKKNKKASKSPSKSPRTKTSSTKSNKSKGGKRSTKKYGGDPSDLTTIVPIVSGFLYILFNVAYRSIGGYNSNSNSNRATLGFDTVDHLKDVIVFVLLYGMFRLSRHERDIHQDDIIANDQYWSPIIERHELDIRNYRNSIDDNSRHIQDHRDMISRLEQERNLLIRQLEDSDRQYDQIIRRNNQQIDRAITERDRAIEQAIRERDRAIREQNQAIEQAIREQDLAIRERDQMITERDQAIRQRDQAIRERDQVITERDQVITERDQVIREQDAEILRLVILMSELQRRPVSPLPASLPESPFEQDPQQPTLEVELQNNRQVLLTNINDALDSPVFREENLRQINLNNEDCLICFEDFNAADDNDGNYTIRLGCKHLFHKNCLIDWVNSRNGDACRCPNDRTVINSERLRRLRHL